MARNRKRANRRPARPQDPTGAQPADADARDNGVGEEVDAEQRFEELEDRLDAIEERAEAGETVELTEPEAEPEVGSEADPEGGPVSEPGPVTGSARHSAAEPAPAPAREHGTAVEAHRAGAFARLANFAQGSWRELQRVQWPDRRQVMQATGVVVGFVIVAGAFLGVADYLSTKLINFILK